MKSKIRFPINFSSFLILLFFSVSAYSQKNYLHLYQNNKCINKSFPDSLSLVKYLNKNKQKYISKGFIEAGYDSIITKNDTLKAYFHKGQKYFFNKIKLPENIIIPVSNKEFVNSRSPSPKYIEQTIEDMLSELENEGYPFAKIYFDSIIISNNKIDGKLVIDKGKYIFVDSLLVKGNTNVKKHFLYKYLKIKPKDPYNEQLIIKIDKKLKNLDFLNIKKASEIFFYNDKVKIKLYADKRKINSFYGIAGIASDERTPGKYLITGQLHLSLKNTFGHGESILTEWNKTNELSQKLKIKLMYPYIFNTSLGVDFGMDLYKQDSSFVNVDLMEGLRFIVSYNSSLSVFAQQKKTITLLAITDTTTLPKYLNSNTSLFGLDFDIKNLDNAYNPRKGFSINAKLAGGEKTIIQPSQLPDYLFKDINKKSLQFETRFTAINYLKITKSLSLKTRANVMYINNEHLFQSDLIRFGGLKTLRGIQEYELYADFASIGSLQLNYFFEELSAFYVFYDIAYYENHIGDFVHDTPMGFGIGTSFNTKAGIFTVSYALSKQFDNPVLFNNARVHIGYISVF